MSTSTATSTEFFNQVASTTFQYINGTLGALLALIIGITVAFWGAKQIARVLKKAI